MLAGIALSLAVAGCFAFGWPVVGERILAGDKGAFSALAMSYRSGPLMIAVFAGAALYIAGALSIAMVVWESCSLPRWAGLLYLIHAPPLCIAAPMTLVVEHLGAFSCCSPAWAWPGVSGTKRKTCGTSSTTRWSIRTTGTSAAFKR